MVRVGSLQERANLEQEQGKKVKRENRPTCPRRNS